MNERGFWAIVLLGLMLVEGSSRPTVRASNTLTKQDQPQAAISITEGAKQQARDGVVYDPSYYRMAYPLGDAPADRGMGTDLVVRAVRKAGYDLQQLIHEDMKVRFSEYPVRGNAPDPSNDHRQAANLKHFFETQGTSKTLSIEPNYLDNWKGGDIVFYQLENGQLDCGIVSDLKNEKGQPMVIHNDAGAIQDDVLAKRKIVGHFRYPK